MKAQLRAWLAEADFARTTAFALERGRAVNALVSLTYDADPLIRWRAIDAIGRCAAVLAPIRLEGLKNQLRRLFWLMNDEAGAVAWRAPEAIGETIQADSRAFADFIPLAVSLLDLEPEDRPPFLPGILYALGRIGEAAPGAIGEALPKIELALAEADSQARAMAVLCLGRAGAREVLVRHNELADDAGEALVYRNGQLIETTVGRLTLEALAMNPAP